MTDEKLVLKYVSVEDLAQWDRNPKRHDLAKLRRSVERYGFKDPPKFEPSLNGGKGGIVEGNGRSAVLRAMRDAGDDPPRGVVVDKGKWLVPVLFGVDAESQKEAEAYGIDHNALTLAGSGLGVDSLISIHEDDLLLGLFDDGVVPVSMEHDEVRDLLGAEWEEPEGALRLSTKNSGAYLRPVLRVDQVDALERALRKTGKANRADALTAVCEKYLNE